MTFRRTTCPHGRAKLEPGQRIHAEFLHATAVARDVDVRYREYA